MAIFFSSDLHFNHTNIIKYCKRPFQLADGTYDVRAMNQAIIENHSMIRAEDTVYFLGDISFDREPGQFLSQIKGHKHLIVGNHDKKTREKLAPYFETINDYLEINVNDPLTKTSVMVVMFHYPIASWNGMHRGSWHLHGHCHGSYKNPYGRILDVGIDNHNMMPFTLGEVAAYMKDRVSKSVDHHKE